MSMLNVGNLDRSIRIGLGGLLITLAAFDVVGPWGYLGIIPLLTGVVALCPLYSLFGWRTNSR
jgi:hypothetical protein